MDSVQFERCASAEVWESLHDAYRPLTDQAINKLYRALVRTKAAAGANIPRHFADMKKERAELAMRRRNNLGPRIQINTCGIAS